MENGTLSSVDDAASLLGAISPRALRTHIAKGAIRVTRIGRRVLRPIKEVERIRREGFPSLRAVATYSKERNES